MIRCRLTCALLSAGFVLVSATFALAADPIVITDLLRLREVASIDVARDGSVAIVGVRSITTSPGASPEASPTYERQLHLYRVRLGNVTSSLEQLTFGARRDSGAVLSPNAAFVAFIREGVAGHGLPVGENEDAVETGSQVWLLPLNGGEARQVTNLPGGVRAVQWSPDGQRLLVTAPVAAIDLEGTPPWPSEHAMPEEPITRAGDDNRTPRADGTRAELSAWLDENARGEDPVVIRRLEFQGEHDLRPPFHVLHLFLVDADDAAPVARRITEGFHDFREAVFLPDGSGILFSGQRRTDVHPDRVRTRGIWRIGPEGGEPESLLAGGDWTYRSPAPGRDGSVVSFLAKRMDDPAYRQWQLGVVPVNREGAGETIWLTDEDSFDRSIWGHRWMDTRSSILFHAGSGGGVPLLAMSMGLLEPAVIVEEHEGLPVGVNVFDAGGGSLLYAVHSVNAPSVLRVRDARGDRVVEDLNPWVRNREISRPELRHLVRPDGTEVDYWVMRPTGFDATKQYPVVLEIHGGPSAMWGPGESTMWHEFQVLASWGYGVVYANPRGSGGYGYAFESANRENWGAGPAGDVLGVMDDVLRDEWVDPDRLVVTGGSYGGYLTAWVVAHDHRFKAAVAQRGVYELATFFGEGNAWRLIEEMMGGLPWEARTRDVLRRESPLTYVNRIRTPLLIMHASEDLRTGVSQSEMLYRALKALNRPVEYVRYPGAGHDLSRTGAPHHRLDRLGRIVEFFERFVANERPAPVRDAGASRRE